MRTAKVMKHVLRVERHRDEWTGWQRTRTGEWYETFRRVGPMIRSKRV